MATALAPATSAGAGTVGQPTQPTTVDPRVPVGVADGRRQIGYGLIATALGLVGVAAWFSLRALDELKPIGTEPTVFDLVRLGVHGAITLAFVLFCYALLQAAERLALPAEWVRTSEDLRLLMGVKTPVALANDELKKVVETISPLLRSEPPKK